MEHFNLNDKVTIYPNEKGWEKIKGLIFEKNDGISWDEAVEIAEKKRTEGNGYRDQLWCIIDDLHEMFFMSQDYLEHTFVDLKRDVNQ